MIVGCLGLAFGLRLFCIHYFPFTNDEGAYLYDASTLVAGRLPAGDILTKSPVVIAGFMAGVWLTHGSLFAARVINLIVSMATVVPLVYIAHRLGNKQLAVITAALWLLGSGSFLFYSYGHTEAIAAFFAVATVALALGAVETGQGRVAFMTGVAFTLAYASRKINLALAPPLLWLLWSHKKMAIALLFGCMTVGMLWLAAVYRVYGTIGVTETLGIGYASIIARHVERVPVDIGGGNTWRSLGIFMRLSLSYVGLLGALWLAKRDGRFTRLSIVCLIWIGALAGLYLTWPVILPDHLADFYPPLTLLSAVSLDKLWQYRPRQRAVMIAALMGATAVSLLSAIRLPWTGMFTARAIFAAADELRLHVPADEPMLTAAVIIPYVSSHRVLYDIAHPLWYRYAFINPSVGQTFLPPLSLIENDIRHGRVQWLLREHLTEYAYFGHLNGAGERVTTIPNKTGWRSNPLTVWRYRNQ